MKPYTVVLLRGPRFSEDLEHSEPFGTDAYVAYVEAASARQALGPAVEQVLAADRKDFAEACHAAGIELAEYDYTLLTVFEGHAKPVFWGWQL